MIKNKLPTFIILSAGQGSRLKPITNDRPKGMVPVAGKTIIDWQIHTAQSCGINNIIVVTGYCADNVIANAKQVYNSRFAETNMVYSLWRTAEDFGNDVIISYGDILYQKNVLEEILTIENEAIVTVDLDFLPYWEQRTDNPLGDLESLRFNSCDNLAEIGQKSQDFSDIQAQYIGLMRFKNQGLKNLILTYRKLEGALDSEKFDNLYMTDLLQEMITQGHTLKAHKINGQWLEIDSLKDKALAESFLNISQGTLTIDRAVRQSPA